MEIAVIWQMLCDVKLSIKAGVKLNPLQEEIDWLLDATNFSSKCE